MHSLCLLNIKLNHYYFLQASQVSDLEEERNKLKEQLAEMSQKIESLEGTYFKLVDDDLFIKLCRFYFLPKLFE